MAKQVIRLAINSINVSPQNSKHIIISLTSPGEILIEFEIDKDETRNLASGAMAVTLQGLRDIITQMGVEVREAHFTLDDQMVQAVQKRQQRRQV